MDLLVEKLDGSRYYLSQYKVLITEFEESAPSVTRNNMQLDQRNGNIDFGGWHKDKTINITGYYRADDMDEEEALREKLYALLSDPNGYYITQLKTTPRVAVERPGETSGGYYDKLTDYPSHKRFLVYTEAPEVELVGNVNGTLLYKLTAEFKTMKLPYGGTPARDVVLNDNKASTVGTNLATGTNSDWQKVSVPSDWGTANLSNQIYEIKDGETYTLQVEVRNMTSSIMLEAFNFTASGDRNGLLIPHAYASDDTKIIVTFTANLPEGYAYFRPNLAFTSKLTGAGSYEFRRFKIERGNKATDWCPNPADPEYNIWRYSLTGNVSIPYSGTVPCNQLEQQFAIELTAMGASSSLSFKIDDTELTYSGGVASGDVFLLTGFSYTQNGLSIVSKTNKAYFILQPDKPNRITCNVPGTVRIIGFQNLYA